MEPGNPDIMRRPPEPPQEAILSRPFLQRIAFYGALITVSTLAVFVWAQDGDPVRATTMAFMTLALAQIFHLGTARGPVPLLRPRDIVANPYALGAVVLALGLQILAMYVAPLAAVLGVVPLQPVDWLVVVTVGALPAVVGQILRLGRRSRR
jgi:Ca2+-transporting ATPase